MQISERDPNHSVIYRPFEYTIIGFNYQIPQDSEPPYIDLTLQKGSEIRRLRFLSPRSLKISEGFPLPTYGMQILDISSRGWDDITVFVDDFEASRGSVTFYAADVIDLNLQKATGC